MTEAIDQVFRGGEALRVTVVDSSSSTPIADDDAAATSVLIFEGPITAKRRAQLSLVGGWSWVAVNETTGGQDIELGASTGAVATIGPGERRLIVCDGSGFYASSAETSFASYTVPVAAVDVTLTADQSTVDQIVIGGTPAASYTVTIDAAAKRAAGTPIKVRNGTAHDQAIADGNGNQWTVPVGAGLIFEWGSETLPTLYPVGVIQVGGVYVPATTTPDAGKVLASLGFGGGDWVDPVPLAWTWFKQAMTDAVNTPSAPDNRAAVVYCSGAMTEDRALVLPLVRRVVLVINATTGGHNVNVRGATGTTAVAAPVGTVGPVVVFCDGVNHTLTP